MRKWKRENSKRKWMTAGFMQVKHFVRLLVLVCSQIYLVFHYFLRPLSRWPSSTGGCDPHYGWWDFERDQSRSSRWSYDRERVWRNTAVSNSKFRLLKSLALSSQNTLSDHFLLSKIGCSISWRWLPGTTVSAHTSWDIWGPDCAQGSEGGWWKAL